MSEIEIKMKEVIDLIDFSVKDLSDTETLNFLEEISAGIEARIVRIESDNE